MIRKMKWTLTLALCAFPMTAQVDYEGSDIRTATPIQFGQVILDNVDQTLRPRVVFSVSLARGQRFSASAKERGEAAVRLSVYSPNQASILNDPSALATSNYQYNVATVEYAVPAAGTYFVAVWGSNGASEIELVVNAVGAQLDVPLPAVASCIEGAVDDIQFNLRQVSMNLADEITVGGVQICASCSVKPTLFSAFVDFLKQAHFSGTRVKVCHASDGQIISVKSARP